MLRQRLITGPILIAVFLGVIWLDERIGPLALGDGWSGLYGSPAMLPAGVVLLAVSLILATLASQELVAVARANGLRAAGWLTALGCCAVLLVVWAMPTEAGPGQMLAALMTVFVCMFAGSLFWFSRGQTVDGVFGATAAVLGSMVYLGVMLSFLLLVRQDHSAWWIVGIVLTVKMSDTSAYFTGHAIGRHKLIPWLSPGKTWEGLIGAVVGAALVGYGCAHATTWLPSDADAIDPMTGLLCGAAFGLLGQAGDLTMSLLKRGAKMKDSSNVLPGLGGVMDVLDSPLLVAPVAYWILAA